MGMRIEDLLQDIAMSGWYYHSLTGQRYTTLKVSPNLLKLLHISDYWSPLLLVFCKKIVVDVNLTNYEYKYHP